MNLKTHIIDTIKEWQIKIGYREGNMKLYYPGESLAFLLEVRGEKEECKMTALETALKEFCKSCESELGQITIDGGWERYCLTIPAKGCAYVAEQIAEPEFLPKFLEVITTSGNSMEQIRRCFAEYSREKNTGFIEERIEEAHHHGGSAFYFEDVTADEYVYWVEKNEFGLNYHRFTREEYRAFFG